MHKILVTGGCGFIGSHTVVDLLENGYEVIVVDNLSNADPAVLEGMAAVTGREVRHYPVDLRDKEALAGVFAEHPDLAGVIHFAAYKLVGESVQKPLEYFENNIGGMINLLFCVRDFQTPSLIFSSSCSVYGNAETLPVTEDTPLQRAESPYGYTKQAGERMIRDFLPVAPHSRAILLRYFNPAGAHESALIGEAAQFQSQNLVPVITETAIGKRAEMQVFGDDYNTRDGSCVRDYIHVMDLARAHTLGLGFQLEGNQKQPLEVFNLGIGQGVTVLEAIRAFEEVSGENLNYRIGPRRPGDVEAVYADDSKARELLGWEPRRDIHDIMRTAWAWEQVRSEKKKT